MKIDKYMKKAYGFFAKTPKEQKEKADQLKKIVEKFTAASKTLHNQIAKSMSKEERKKKQQELKIVEKLLKKARKKYKELSTG